MGMRKSQFSERSRVSGGGKEIFMKVFILSANSDIL